MKTATEVTDGLGFFRQDTPMDKYANIEISTELDDLMRRSSRVLSMALGASTLVLVLLGWVLYAPVL